ncbi:hypothetical protein DFJ77DRAFT_459423 [Powellomyces hirtus]|nr:hypothetical protein DFJ77DRAFT_459423 [Powellomyces hirtus]
MAKEPETPSFQSREQELSVTIAQFFTDDALSYDRGVTKMISELEGRWIPIRVLTSRKVGTDDEAVVAHAVRTYVPTLEISDDGKSVRRRTPVPDFGEQDSRSIYVDHLPIKANGELLRAAFTVAGPVAKVILPPKALIPRSEFAFVVFDHKDTVAKALDIFGSRFQELANDSDLRSFTDDIEHDDKLGHIRVMPKSQWIELTNNYETLLGVRTQQLQEHTRNQAGWQTAQYQSKVVGRFSDVFRGTNTKIIKRLFEMIAPVTFVDFSPKENNGFIRFKTPHGARLAFTYFTNEYVVQTHAYDCGTLCESKKKKKNASNDTSESADLQGRTTDEPVELEEADLPNVKFELLTGDEETAYWERIVGRQEEKHWYQTHPPVSYSAPTSGRSTAGVKSHDVRQDPADHDMRSVNNSELPSRAHIKFDNSDEDSDVESPPSPRAGKRKQETDEGSGAPATKRKK